MFTTILVPVDLGGLPEEIRRLAIAFAAEQQATLHFLYALDEGRDFAGAAYTAIDPGVVRFHEREIDALLGGLVEAARAAGVRAESRVAEGRPAWQVILREAEALKSDLIVMRTHGRAGLSHAVSGSVTEDVLRRSPVPVLAVQIPSA